MASIPKNNIYKPFTVPYQQLLAGASQSSAHIPASTKGLAPLPVFWGQQRAHNAIKTALNVSVDGYNVFAAGNLGLGKRTMVRKMLQAHARTMPTPSDWVYVNNFANPREPIAIELPVGEAGKFQASMHKLWLQIYRSLSQRFTSQSYQQNSQRIRSLRLQKQQDAIAALKQEGEALGLLLQVENKNFFFVAADLEGKALNPEALLALEAQQQRLLTNAITKMNRKIEVLASKSQKIEESVADELLAMGVETAADIVESKFAPVVKAYASHKPIRAYIADYIDDVLVNLDLVLSQDEADFAPTQFSRVPARYQVNIMVSHKPGSGAPIVELDLPTYFNMVGCIEQQTLMGTISTDFSLIRPGALHAANGGFLLMDLEPLLEQPYAWHGLKRVLRLKQIKLSSLEQMLTLTGTLSLAPAPIRLEIKVVLFGEPSLYYEMLELDPEFDELFKIRADFDNSLLRTPANEVAFVQLIADYIGKKQLLHFDKSALMALLYDASRVYEDQKRLSLNAAKLGDLLAESSFAAKQDGKRKVSAVHVAKAIAERTERMGYLQEAFWREIHDGTQLLRTQGVSVGQINALTVIQYADSEFGMPVRLTASVHQGGGDIVDIESVVELGGAIHSKGMLILTHFIKSYFGRNMPLHFSAGLAFEQSYSQIDGDSATLAGICALISAITNIPVRQDIAITGSMNQLGEVQPIGGVNAKIEGFFDACRHAGLTGTQGVIVPKQNLQHIMLRDDVLAAIKAKRFTIYAAARVEDVLQMTLGTPMGKSGSDVGSIYHAVMAQMHLWKQIEDKEGEPKESDAKEAD